MKNHRSPFAATVAALGLLLTAQAVSAGSATWTLNPATGNWNTAANWTPATVPNGASDQATFGVSNTVALNTTVFIRVGEIVFNAGANAFTIAPGPAFPFDFTGTGVTNNSGLNQSFTVGTINFTNSASAGNQTTYTANGGASPGQNPGILTFLDFSSGGNATLIANGGTNGGNGGLIQFSGTSTGGTANVQLHGNGTMSLSGHTPGSFFIGSFVGDGVIDLGANNLTLNGANLAPTFDGVIEGTGGLTINQGNLTLTGASTYSGGTTIAIGGGADKGLTVANTTGSATGSGPISILGAYMNGTGAVDGPVTVSNFAELSPSYLITPPHTLTLRGGVTWNQLGRFTVNIDLDSGRHDMIVANGVTLTGAILPTLVVNVSGGRTRYGTRFTLINNTSSSPIVGNFDHYPEGEYINLGHHKILVVSYVGGDGNDMTLTLMKLPR